MTFNSLTFLIFFAAVLALHALPLPWSVRKLNLLLASYLFYAAWDPRYVILLVIPAVVDYFLAHAMQRTARPRLREILLATGLILNLGLLAYFKYAVFLIDNVVALFGLAGISWNVSRPTVMVPLGISFYTFETVSYLIDVYRRRVVAWRNFLDYALFLTFFPHLVAGPIVRAGDFLPQCVSPRRPNAAQLGWGLSLMLLGLFQKVFVADGLLAAVADRVFAQPAQAGCWDAWLGVLAFAGQILCDFSGYSTCGIGCALALGFVLNDNFRRPYGARGVSDFWQRWHISLSSWLRDYVYVPFGGNRAGRFRTLLNLVLTMLIGGLWHGAAWQFVVWGLLYGVYLVLERLSESRRAPAAGAARRGLPAIVTFGLVLVGWVFFRAASLHDAWELLVAMAEPFRTSSLIGLAARYRTLLVIGLLLIAQNLWRDRSWEDMFCWLPWWGRSFVLTTLMLCIWFAPGDERTFIYFQF
jgi:D-alanyl-lipoteichoic acid acyltransferase DltB (MBOAT superfamily)